ncbi:peroxiredoxin family protein [Stieleria varia]|uniref:Thioredoxin domain-containing protein n=1 Tax=Stieleria varia TaxID=2528005 RepID=A0A5C6ATM6_9BACT|nr:TlpA disulfide reductase family protein [Stieleria varia]TWU02416.1 hypothetical protein Pla52n_34660 [Stieleria varia]
MTLSLRLSASLCLLSLLCFGCSKSTDSDSSNASAAGVPSADGGVQSAAELAARGVSPDVGDDTFGHTYANASERADDVSRSQPAGADLTGMKPGDPPNNPASLIPEGGLTLADPSSSTDDGSTNARPLRDDLTPQELTGYLSATDRDMELIATGRAGISDQSKAMTTMMQIVEQKLEAARQLAEHPQATPEDKVTGIRGQMQALSHMAGGGDVQAAQKLETLAKEQVNSSDQRIASDSQIVLVGFAIESLRNGKANAETQMVELINQLAKSKNVDVAALMVMGQARNTLAMYGHATEAQSVGETISNVFGDSSDPMIANMAAQLAGNARFDETTRMINTTIQGGDVPVGQWSAAANRLIDAAPDLSSVQQLAGAALQFEALGLSELVDETFRVLTDRFPDADSETRTEVNIAMDAQKRREDVLGTLYQPSLPAVDGAPLSLADYRGKVVLMPLWAVTLEESLQVIPQLKLMRDADPDNIAIVGINLDPQEAPVEEFAQKSELGFRNFRSISSAQQRVANPVAVQFGAVSFPFVVILDQEGRVAALDFSGLQLQSSVQQLLKK